MGNKQEDASIGQAAKESPQAQILGHVPQFKYPKKKMLR